MSQTAITGALVFLNAIGTDVPLAPSYTYKHVGDVLRREGFAFSGAPSADVLADVGEQIGVLSNGHIHVSAKPVLTHTGRSPLSVTDLAVARVTMAKCADCGEPVVKDQRHCAACAEEHEPAEGIRRIAVEMLPLQVGATVRLHSGVAGHIVDTDGFVHTGMDDQFETFSCIATDIAAWHNLDDPIVLDCPTCGEMVEGDSCPLCHSRIMD
jgi:hypothetical protein